MTIINDLRLGPSIQKITILATDAATGQVVPNVIYVGRQPKKKGSRRLKPVESAVRRAMEAVSASADDYLDRHDDSNAKKRDGWLMELPGNVYKSVKKGSKRMKTSRLMEMMPMRM
jgi:hypothetical protein